MWCRQFPDKDCGLPAHSCALHLSHKTVQLPHWSVVFTNMNLQLSITKKYKSAKFHLHPKYLWKGQSLVAHLSYPISNIILKSFLAWRRIFSKLKWDHERMKVKKKNWSRKCLLHVQDIQKCLEKPRIPSNKRNRIKFTKTLPSF